MIVAVELPRDIDLSHFSRLLHQSGIWHRVNESGEFQIVWVESEADKSRVNTLYSQFANSELEFVPTQVVAKPSGRLLREVARSPFTLTLILANIICFPVTWGVEDYNFSSWFQSMTLLEFQVSGNSMYFANLEYTLSSGQYWRLITPMLLHFGWIHIVFNLLWVWEIGRRIESLNGVFILLSIVLFSSLSANLTQYWISGASLFGGMSGVVYGLLGYSLIWSFFVPEKSLGIPKGIYVVMLVFLVVGFTGAIDLLGLGSLANGAHLGGLLGGASLGLIAIFIYRFRIIQN